MSGSGYYGHMTKKRKSALRFKVRMLALAIMQCRGIHLSCALCAIPTNQHDPRTNYYWIQAYFVTIYMEAASCLEKFNANDTHLMVCILCDKFNRGIIWQKRWLAYYECNM